MLNSLAANQAFEKLQMLAEEYMQRTRVPGLTIVVTNLSETLATRCYGFANLESKMPVTNQTRFEIGSISKSFTSILILQLVEQGLLDLHAPVETYLPWFQPKHSLGTITVHHLLSHTSGLSVGSDSAPESIFVMAAACDLKPGWEPGTKFSYSNLGYKLLGAILERIHGQPLDTIIRARILEPLEMQNSFPIITQQNRPEIATGYTNQYDDRPAHSSHKLFPATFVEAVVADGSLACTSEDLCKYARMILRRGAPLISDSSFAQMTAPHATREIFGMPETSYGYGIANTNFEGVQAIWHGGGMIGYSSILLVMPELGFGLVIFRNSSVHSMIDFSLETLELFCKAAMGLEIEAKPKRNLLEFAGTFENAESQLEFVQQNDQLFLKLEAELIPLESHGGDSFCSAHEIFKLFPFEFIRNPDRKIVEVCHGENAYWNSSYHGEQTFDFPKHWLEFIGYYRSHSPWYPCFRVVIRKSKLLLMSEDFTSALEPDGNEFVLEGSPERMRFDTIISGLAQRAIFSGSEYVRISPRGDG